MAGGDRSWAELHPDLLGRIIQRMSIFDVLSFAAVCTAWASAAPPRTNVLPAPHMPYLLLPGEDGETSEHCTLLSLPDRRSRRLGPLPDLRGKWLVGSQDGWVSLVDPLSNPSLLNPLTGAHVRLPPISTLPNLQPLYEPSGGGAPTIWGYRYGECRLILSLKRFRSEFSIKKMVFSSCPNNNNNSCGFSVLALFDEGEDCVLLLRSGDQKWTEVGLSNIEDAVYHPHYGKFLVVYSDGAVVAVDPSAIGSGSTTIMTSGFECSWEEDRRYLVADSSGEFLQVCRCTEEIDIGEDSGCLFRTKRFEVRKLDPLTSTWVIVQSLGDSSLFLGNCCSMLLSAREIPGLKADSIYFADDRWDDICTAEGQKLVRDVGVYNLKDASWERESHITSPAPTWITPSLL